MANRYVSVLIPRTEVRQFSSQISTRICHIIFSAVMFKYILSTVETQPYVRLLSPQISAFLKFVVDVTPAPSPVDNTWRHWT
jgi:hypothetical protein